ncbi:MAG: hypothetical protein WC628_08440 [Candidatus Omnitrophota bacterium]
MPKLKTILAGLVLVFYSTTALAEKAASKETTPVKRETSTRSNTIITQSRPAPSQPAAPPKPVVAIRSEIRKPPLNFRVNPPVRIKKSSLQVLAGVKEPNTAILINNQEVIPINEYKTWYYEYPLKPQTDNKISVAMAYQANRLISVTSLDLNNNPVSLDTEPPVITGIRLEPQTKDIIITIKDPAGVLSYNIYYANSLNSMAGTTPFVLAQSDFPVSGTGTTLWRDNGTYTGTHPFSPGIKIRFYKLGVARISPASFKLTSITPADNSVFLAGVKINIQASVSNPNNEALQYQFSIAGTVMQPWSISSSYIWQTSVSDTAIVNIICEVKDTKGNKASKTISYRIINPTVEEILQKVADNYKLLADFKANMSVTTVLDSQPLGKEGYYIYYFKKPDKEKIETYSSSGRTQKTDITIINGSTMYLVNPVTKITKEINLLEKAKIDANQFKQQDLIYNTLEFINVYTLTRNDNDSDLTNFIIALEAVPKQENYLYEKLEFFIDYNKGLLMKNLLFKNGSLREKLEVQESRLMPNNAWLPVKMIKIPMLTSGNMVSTLTYSDIKINVGLTEDDFNSSKQ